MIASQSGETNHGSAENMRLISVIVPTCNRHDDLFSCLRLLANDSQDIGETVYEVIVTDDGQDEALQRKLKDKFPGVRYTRGPSQGPASNRNHGASISVGEWLVFIDDDCLPEKNLIRTYVQLADTNEKSDLVVYMGATVPEVPVSSLLWVAPDNPNGEEYISANFMIERDCFHKIGQFDGRYPHAAFEDTEFFHRFLACGGVIIPCPQARVTHPLRKVGSGTKLGAKWEARVIYALDQGALPVSLLWRLPLHAAKVIPSRYRGKKIWLPETLVAATGSVSEFLTILFCTPLWVYKWSRRPRSQFWMNQKSLGCTNSEFGL